MIHLSPDVVRLSRVPHPTTKWCADCNSPFVLLPSKEGLKCQCRYIQISNGLEVDLTRVGKR